ncbi:MAG: putative ATPase [Clostridium sp.]|jgi:predicted ATPase
MKIAYEDLIKRNALNKIIFVHGEQGIGKTRLLKEIEYLLYMKKANVYASFTIEKCNSKSNKALIEILKKIVSTSDEEIVKRYQGELIKFIPEIGVEHNIVVSESLVGNKEKYRLISRIYSFIEEAINNKPTVFIIDNAHCLDDFSLELLEYINVQNYNQQNLMAILSYNTGEYTSSNKFQALINRNSYNMNVYLKNLDNDETAIMIQEILSYPKVPSEFGKKIYEKTYGNPLFVEETLKDFVAKKILHINEANGKWRTPYEPLDELPIASTMEQALLNQIKEINKDSYEILSIIAIFNTAVSIEVIEKLSIRTENIIEMYIDELCSKGILCKKIEDMGFVFDFNNKVLKNLIYNRLSEEERNVRHEIAASVLENLFENDGRENKEELIYHLEKAKDKHRLVKYCIEIAQKMKSFRIMDEAISKYEKAFSMLSDEEDQNKKVRILLEIGDIYSDTGNLSGALEAYKKIREYSVDLLEEKLQVDCANKIAFICMKKNEVEKALQYIKKGESILLNIDYVEGYLENKKILANVYTAKQEYDKVFDICTNKLSGIVSGNAVQDSRNVLAMVELIEIIKEKCDVQTKIYNALGRIIETTEAKYGMLFTINENKITEKFGRRIFKENWIQVKAYSEDIIESVIIDKQGICIIDWDSVVDYDLVTGMPNWNSVLTTPIIKSGIVRAILYLTVPIKFKEFKFEDLNFVNTLGQLLVGIL